jgi:hypothetical protein
MNSTLGPADIERCEGETEVVNGMGLTFSVYRTPTPARKRLRLVFRPLLPCRFFSRFVSRRILVE